jgi:hypothetical protein
VRGWRQRPFRRCRSSPTRNGKRREDGSGLDALQAFDPDIAHRERVHRPCALAAKAMAATAETVRRRRPIDVFFHEWG